MDHGDPEVFLHEHLPRLARYAAVLTGNREQAHDVLTDALVYALSRWSRIRTMQYPDAYLRRCVTSAFLDSKRRRRHETTDFSAEDVDGPDPSADAAYQRVLDNAEIAGALHQLPPLPTSILVLRHYLGLSTAEIAAELGLMPNAVRSYESRARRTLQGNLTATNEGHHHDR